MMVRSALAFAEGPPRRIPSAASDALAAIIAEATAYARNIGPAADAFHSANEACVDNKDADLDEVLSERERGLEDVWHEHLDHFFTIAERALKLPAATRDALNAQVTAYAELLDPIVGEQEYETPLERLPKESLLIVIDHLINQHAGVVCRSSLARAS